MKSTSDTYDYHHTSKTGFWGSKTGLSTQVGTKKSTTKNSNSSVTHTGSIIASTSGSVNMSANTGDININGSSVLAKQDINISENNINFNTVQNKTNGNHYQKDSFTGLSVGVSGIVSDISKAGMTASNATDSQSQAFSSANTAFPALQSGLGEVGVLEDRSLTNTNNNLIGVSASIGHSSNKSSSTTTTMTDVGSIVTAGGKVNINGKKDINATASNKIGVGASASVGIAGGSVGLTAEGSLGWGITHHPVKPRLTRL